MTLAVFLCLFTAASAQADKFGILSETYVYPDGIRLDTDSKLWVWGETATLSNDAADKREGQHSLKAVSNFGRNGWEIISDQDNDNSPDNYNMSPYSSGSLEFWIKSQVDLEIKIKANKEASFTLSGKGIPTNNQWTFVSVPFSGFSNISGFNFAQVNRFLIVVCGSAPNGSTYHLDNLRWNTGQTGPLDHITVSPASFAIPVGYPKSFIATGYDASNNVRDIYPTWSSSGLSGSFTAAEGLSTIYTPATSPATGTITATEGGVSGSSNVTVASYTWNDFFHLINDGGVYGELGGYDSDDGDGDGDGTENNSITLDTVTAVSPPGLTKSLEAIYSIQTYGWAGYYFHEGPLTNVSDVRDLSAFANKYITFWVKTPVDLEMGIRTRNIDAGQERSKIMLSEYSVPADNNWHEVFIAADDFKNRDDRLDFSESKVFFNFAVIGEKVTDHSDKFYVAGLKYIKTKSATADISVAIKKRNTNEAEPSGEIGFSGASLGGGWTIGDQYMEITYDTIALSWGMQIYSDNKAAGANPQYPGNPATSLDQQPAGMLGVATPDITCPMTWLALDTPASGAGVITPPARLAVDANDTLTLDLKPFIAAGQNPLYYVYIGGDIDNDGTLEASDIQLIIDKINSGQGLNAGDPGWNPQMDIDSNDVITPLDILLPINMLNAGITQKPAAAVMNLNTGIFTWPTTASDAGTYYLTFVARDGAYLYARCARIRVTDMPLPVEADNGLSPGDPDYRLFFKSDVNGMWGGEPAKAEWAWLKDKSSTRWVDSDGDGNVDSGEIKPDFSLTGDTYSTIADQLGLATNWFDTAGNSLYSLNPESPIVIYFAANFQKAKTLQRYKTNTLTLELYHR